jgi:hypothetical protein
LELERKELKAQREKDCRRHDSLVQQLQTEINDVKTQERLARQRKDESNRLKRELKAMGVRLAEQIAAYGAIEQESQDVVDAAETLLMEMGDE